MAVLVVLTFGVLPTISRVVKFLRRQEALIVVNRAISANDLCKTFETSSVLQYLSFAKMVGLDT